MKQSFDDGVAPFCASGREHQNPSREGATAWAPETELGTTVDLNTRVCRKGSVGKRSVGLPDLSYRIRWSTTAPPLLHLLLGAGSGETAAALPPKKKHEPGKRLKQLHWIKVNERTFKTTIWKMMKDDQVQLRRQEMEQLCEAKISAKNLNKGDKEGGDELETVSFGPRRKRRVMCCRLTGRRPSPSSSPALRRAQPSPCARASLYAVEFANVRRLLRFSRVSVSVFLIPILI